MLLIVVPTVGSAGSGVYESCVRYSGNPILIPGIRGSWDATDVGRAFVMFNGTHFNMWYSRSAGHQSIGFAKSRDGMNWTKYPSPVLTAGQNDSWDSYGVYAPSVVWNGTMFLMYFTGINSSPGGIGVAFSKDMVHWQKYAKNPILGAGPGAYDAFYVRYPSVVYDLPGFRMWYTSRSSIHGSNTISYATSQDGLSWVKYGKNPVIVPNRSTFANFDSARFPSVRKINSTYLMTFELRGNIVTYATSLDGGNWSSTYLPLLVPLNASAWDASVEYPSAVLRGSAIWLYYTGRASDNSTQSDVGVAFCPFVIITSTTSLIFTFTTTLTSSQTLTTTETVRLASPEVPVYQVSSILLGTLFLGTLFFLWRRRRLAIR